MSINLFHLTEHVEQYASSRIQEELPIIDTQNYLSHMVTIKNEHKQLVHFLRYRKSYILPITDKMREEYMATCTICTFYATIQVKKDNIYEAFRELTSIDLSKYNIASTVESIFTLTHDDKMGSVIATFYSMSELLSYKLPEKYSTTRKRTMEEIIETGTGKIQTSLCLNMSLPLWSDSNILMDLNLPQEMKNKLIALRRDVDRSQQFRAKKIIIRLKALHPNYDKGCGDDMSKEDMIKRIDELIENF